MIEAFLGKLFMIWTDQFDYKFIPASINTWGKKPQLMIVLHGRGDSLNPFRTLPAELDLPHMNFLLLNAPRSYLDGYSWYAFPPNQKTGVLAARARLFFLLEQLQEQGWASEDIFFFGFSQGCLISCDMGLHYPKRLGGIIGISGYIYFFAKWAQKIQDAAYHTPWLLTHGLRDEALAIDETRNHVHKLLLAGLPVTWKEFNKDHEIDEELELPFIRRWILAHVTDKIRRPKMSQRPHRQRSNQTWTTL